MDGETDRQTERRTDISAIAIPPPVVFCAIALVKIYAFIHKQA